MAIQVAEQVAARDRWPAVSVGVPILASKITAPGVPDWVVPLPRITELIAGGMRWCPLTIATGPAGAGKDDGAGVLGGGRARAGSLDWPG